MHEKMHEHVTCKSKNIMGSAQSNPTSTYHFNIVSTHLKCMNHLKKCKCDVMHEHLRSFKQNPNQKFCKNFINFEKPQKFSKSPKVRSEYMKCMIK